VPSSQAFRTRESILDPSLFLPVLSSHPLKNVERRGSPLISATVFFFSSLHPWSVICPIFPPPGRNFPPPRRGVAVPLLRTSTRAHFLPSATPSPAELPINEAVPQNSSGNSLPRPFFLEFLFLFHSQVRANSARLLFFPFFQSPIWSAVRFRAESVSFFIFVFFFITT